MRVKLTVPPDTVTPSTMCNETMSLPSSGSVTRERAFKTSFWSGISAPTSSQPRINMRPEVPASWRETCLNNRPRDSAGLGQLQVIPVGGIPEVEPGANLVEMIIAGLKRSRVMLVRNDVLVVKQKVVSKAEGRLVNLDYVNPGELATRIANEQGKDARLVEVVLGEATRIVRVGQGVIITETRQGFVCANSGVDKSNVRDGYVALLPVDPDKSAMAIRKGLERRSGKKLAVIVSDTFGRPWRKGQTDVAIGCSGIDPLWS